MYSKNELIGQVVSSTEQEDTSIIKNAVFSAIEKVKNILQVPEYSISGALVYTRLGDILRVSSKEHIYGYCTPLLKLDTLKHIKKKQYIEGLILKTIINVNKLQTANQDQLSNWFETLVKEILEKKQKITIRELPKELAGFQRLIMLYPIFDKDILNGILVIYKDAFDKLFPEEENAMNLLVENLKVALAIIKGKNMPSAKYSFGLNRSTNISTNCTKAAMTAIKTMNCR